MVLKIVRASSSSPAQWNSLGEGPPVKVRKKRPVSAHVSTIIHVFRSHSTETSVLVDVVTEDTGELSDHVQDESWAPDTSSHCTNPPQPIYSQVSV